MDDDVSRNANEFVTKWVSKKHQNTVAQDKDQNCVNKSNTTMRTSEGIMNTALTYQLLPHVTHPIVCAPMCGMSMGKLAGSVASAGAVGLIGIGSSRVFGPDRVREEYSIAKSEIASSTTNKNPVGALGFGFIESFMDEESGDESFNACLDLNPDVMFLSGYTRSKSSDTSIQKWIQRVREKNKNNESTTKIIVQTFTVAEAVSAACWGAHAVVIQGCDAGGHGRQDLATSIVSLVPQTRRALNEAGFENCVLLAAGGIASGAQMAAALTLGADGVLMGSAFVVAEECKAKDSFKERIVHTHDGTCGTLVSPVWDCLSKMGKPFLSGAFVGRALLDSETVKQFEGKDEKEISDNDIQWYAQADYRARAVWCSSSIGLLEESTPKKARHIVETTVAEAIAALVRPKHFSVNPPSDS